MPVLPSAEGQPLIGVVWPSDEAVVVALALSADGTTHEVERLATRSTRGRQTVDLARRRGAVIERCTAIVGLLALAGCARAAETNEWLTFRDGRLVYGQDAAGNRIPDYSYCGFRGGGVALPDVPVAASLSPSGTADDGPRIQAAIDALAAKEPGADGFRGALLLRRGTYRIAGTLRLAASGIVLRGEGEGQDGTVLVAAGQGQRTLIQVAGKDRPREDTATRQPITDEHVPLGSRQVTVADASGFAVGDAVIVKRVSSAAWIQHLKMDQLPPRRDGGKVTQWTAGSKDLSFDRRIEQLEGRTLTLDAPLGSPIEQPWGGGTVAKAADPGKIRLCGVEQLRGDSEFTSPKDEDHGWTFISFESIEDGWARHVTTIHYGMGNVSLGRYAKRVTVADCTCLDPISVITGGRRYSFNLHGQLCLVIRCRSREARHDYATGSVVCGPNAFVDCVAEQTHADTGPHHRWAVSTLYDNVSSRLINAQNRGNMGSGHGWAGAFQVFWNCAAEKMIVESPPTAYNWVFGTTVKDAKGEAEWLSPNQALQPRSLYLQQLQERLGDDAVRAIGG